VDRPATGNVTELSKEQRRYRSVRFTGQHYTSTQDGVTVINQLIATTSTTELVPTCSPVCTLRGARSSFLRRFR
jgi:hypothetical protein